MCICISTGPHVFIYTVCRPGVHKGCGKVINPLELELRNVESDMCVLETKFRSSARAVLTIELGPPKNYVSL